MTTEKRYELVCKMMREYGKMDNRGIWDPENMIRDPFGAYHTQYGKPYSFEPFYEAATELLRDALAGISEKSTPKTVAAAVKRMLATDDTRPALKFMHRTEFRGETRYAVCDGYRALALKHDITCLPHANEGETFIDMNQTMDLEKHEEIHLPTVKELKATIAAHPELDSRKTKRKRAPALLDEKIGVNAIYLLDMLQALPGCRAWMTGSFYKPIYFESEDGDGILLPVKLSVDALPLTEKNLSTFPGVHI